MNLGGVARVLRGKSEFFEVPQSRSKSRSVGKDDTHETRDANGAPQDDVNVKTRKRSAQAKLALRKHVSRGCRLGNLI
jgi:hypothetical protein